MSAGLDRQQSFPRAATEGHTSAATANAASREDRLAAGAASAAVGAGADAQDVEMAEAAAPAVAAQDEGHTEGSRGASLQGAGARGAGRSVAEGQGGSGAAAAPDMGAGPASRQSDRPQEAGVEPAAEELDVFCPPLQDDSKLPLDLNVVASSQTVAECEHAFICRRGLRLCRMPAGPGLQLPGDLLTA